MRVQRYTVSCEADPLIGGMVFSGNDSDTVIGLVVGVLGNLADVVLFEAVDVSDFNGARIDVTAESLTQEEVLEHVGRAIDAAAPDVQSEWRRACVSTLERN